MALPAGISAAPWRVWFTGRGGIARFPNADGRWKIPVRAGGLGKKKSPVRCQRGLDNRVQPSWSLEATNVETTYSLKSAMAWVVSVTVGVPLN